MQAPPCVENTKEFISLLRFKDAARKLLPAGSTARSIITAEPDILPMAEALSKFEVFDRLLVAELGAARRPR